MKKREPTSFTVKERFSIFIDQGPGGDSFTDFVKNLNTAEKTLLRSPKCDPKTLRVEVSMIDDGFVGFWVTGLREPTKAEIRRKEELAALAVTSRRAEYERLRAEFEPEKVKS